MLLSNFIVLLSSTAIMGTATPSLPTIVVVPGAWHSPVHYTELLALFEAAGYPTSSSVLPSVDPPNPNITTATTDADFIKDNILAPLLSQGKEIVMVMHSYGGSPGGAAANGLSKVERTAAGKTGGIIGLVFIAALLVQEGTSLLTAVGGTFNPWVEVNTPPGYLTPSTPIEVFYNDVSSAVADWAVKALKIESQTALSTGAPPPGWANPEFDGCRAYVRTALDHCIPPAAQDGMMAASGVIWDVHPFNTSHSPFLSEPGPLSQTIISLAKAWSSLEGCTSTIS